jgi:hypothetical protein
MDEGELSPPSVCSFRRAVSNASMTDHQPKMDWILASYIVHTDIYIAFHFVTECSKFNLKTTNFAENFSDFIFVHCCDGDGWSILKYILER